MKIYKWFNGSWYTLTTTPCSDKYELLWAAGWKVRPRKLLWKLWLLEWSLPTNTSNQSTMTTPTTEGWEKRFDEKFSYLESPDPENLKAFILEVEKQAEERGQDEVANRVRQIKSTPETDLELRDYLASLKE